MVQIRICSNRIEAKSQVSDLTMGESFPYYQCYSNIYSFINKSLEHHQERNIYTFQPLCH
jgi:hypothetical protein